MKKSSRAGSPVTVRLLSGEFRLADLVVIGSHCVGLDFLLGQLQRRGFRTKFLAVGSTGGLQAAQRGECDLAGMHLLDPQTGRYNEPYLTAGLEMIRGYGRLQGIVYRPGDPRFEGRTALEAVRQVAPDPDCVMVNRNQGSGTRILIDRLLGGIRPPGYPVQARSHNAVAAGVAQGRARLGCGHPVGRTERRTGFSAVGGRALRFRGSQQPLATSGGRRVPRAPHGAGRAADAGGHGVSAGRRDRGTRIGDQG